MCWICVGYVWCEIRQQSSEEPCDETSFGKNIYRFKKHKIKKINLIFQNHKIIKKINLYEN